MKKITIPKRTYLLDRLAQKTAAVRKTQNAYEQGHPAEKVWENFQISKGLKRAFVELCEKHSINKSDYLRKCVIALIREEGDVSTILKKLGQNDTHANNDTD